MADNPATVVLCGPLGSVRATPGGFAVRRGITPGQPPVTWIARLDDLLRGPVHVPAEGDPSRGLDIALALEPAWLDSRRALREAVHRAQAVAPALDAAVLTGAPLREHGLLAEMGIRVVVVDHLDRSGRGSRRPPPAGWPCRNVTWGLWEVEKTDPARRPGLWHRLTHGSGLPTTRAGSLQVLCDENRETVRHGLGRWVKATERRQARGAVVAVRLGDLAAMLDRGSLDPGCPASGSHVARGSLLAAA
jgi:hypothetical protein